MRGLTIVVADLSSERFRSALNLACAQAALGGRARLFLDREAVATVRQPITGWEDDAYRDAGLPTLPAHVEEALDLGVAFILCQSGLAMTGAELSDYDPRMTTGGMISLLQTLGDDRLLTV